MNNYNPYNFISQNPFMDVFLQEYSYYSIIDVDNVEINQMLVSEGFELWFPLEPVSWSGAKTNVFVSWMT